MDKKEKEWYVLFYEYVSSNHPQIAEYGETYSNENY